ncbi:hypothetical protein PM082_019858 [Marasmius tenuissimus]|nr:hypothetical protein PM082_019858 [Marasmius tenuissimus]
MMRLGTIWLLSICTLTALAPAYRSFKIRRTWWTRLDWELLEVVASMWQGNRAFEGYKDVLVGAKVRALRDVGRGDGEGVAGPLETLKRRFPISITCL